MMMIICSSSMTTTSIQSHPSLCLFAQLILLMSCTGSAAATYVGVGHLDHVSPPPPHIKKHKYNAAAAAAAAAANNKHYLINNRNNADDIPPRHNTISSHGTHPKGNPPQTNGGKSHSPYVQGGAGVIPFYAAAGGRAHYNHHNQGIPCKPIPPAATLFAISTLAWII